MKLDIALLTQDLVPFVTQLIYLVLIGVASWAIKQVGGHFKFQLTQNQWDVVRATAHDVANGIIAGAEPSIMAAVIEPSNPLVTEAANLAIKKIPDVLTALGITPATESKFVTDHLVPLIIAQIGDAQIRAANAAIALVKPIPGNTGIVPPNLQVKA